MSRLITFGCSHTFGDGMPDCTNPLSNGHARPSKLGWASILSELLGRKLLNKADPGASVKEVVYKLDQTLIKEEDIVIILWPSSDRYCQINSPSEYNKIIPTGDDDLTKNYYRHLHNTYDSYITNSLFIKYAQAYVKQKGAKLIEHFVIDEDKTAYKEFKINNNRVPYYYYNYIGFPLTECLHLGQEGQKAFAYDLYEDIRTGKFPNRKRK